MRKSLRMKVGAAGTTFALAGALAVVASGTTGAYFSDTKTGGITGTVGSVSITTSGGVSNPNGDHIDFVFNDLAPGVAQQAVVTFTNTGSMAQDVYLAFPITSALHAFNNLKTDGEVNILGGPTGASSASLFHSTNLNDGRTDPAPELNSCSWPFVPDTTGPGCNPMPNKILVASNVAAGGTGSLSFGFNYSATYGDATLVPYSTGLTGGGVFNSYPVWDAFEWDAADIGEGLPFQVIAVQVGQHPAMPAH